MNVQQAFFSIPHSESKLTHKVPIAAETITKMSINTENNAPYVIPTVKIFWEHKID